MVTERQPLTYRDAGVDIDAVTDALKDVGDMAASTRTDPRVLSGIGGFGALFRADRTELVKTNLMIFIKPTILRDDIATAYETNAKYQSIREMQLAEKVGRRELIRDLQPPVLPEMDASESPTPVIDLRQLQEAPAEVSEEAG